MILTGILGLDEGLFLLWLLRVGLVSVVSSVLSGSSLLPFTVSRTARVELLNNFGGDTCGGGHALDNYMNHVRSARILRLSNSLG